MSKIFPSLKVLGIKHICTEALHLNAREVSTFTTARLSHFEQDEIDYCLPRKTFQTYVKKIIPILIKNDFHVVKVGMPFYSDFFTDIKKVFGKIFSNQYDIINFAFNEIKTGIVTFDDFYNVSVDNKSFFERNFKYVNKYLVKANIHVWGESDGAKKIFSLKGVLNFIWNHDKINSSLRRNQLFRTVVDDNFNPILDKHNNIQLYFDKGIYPTERIINIKNCCYANK